MDWMVSSFLDTRHNRVQHAAPRPEQYSDCWDNCWVSTSTSWRNRMFSYNDTATESTIIERQKKAWEAQIVAENINLRFSSHSNTWGNEELGRIQASGKTTSSASLIFRRLWQTWYRWWVNCVIRWDFRQS